MYSSDIGEKICFWADEAENRATKKGFCLGPSVELYLQVDDEDCNYYFIDRIAQTVFWLEEYETSDLGLHPVISPSHLSEFVLHFSIDLFSAADTCLSRMGIGSPVLGSYREFLNALWRPSPEVN